MALMGSRRRAYHRAEAKRKRSKWVPSAEAAAREIRRTRKLRYRKHRRHVLLVVLAVSLAIGALASALVLRLVTVRGTGMSPTLESGECVLCVRQVFLDKTVGLLPERIWRIGRDDLVLIDYAPKDDEGNRKKDQSALLVKRVIGVGGDVIDVQNGQMTVNGNPVPGLASGGDLVYPVTVPSKTLFVMGDHRSVAVDSRMRAFGMVGEDEVAGRPVAVIWPVFAIGPVH